MKDVHLFLICLFMTILCTARITTMEGLFLVAAGVLMINGRPIMSCRDVSETVIYL